MKNNTSNPNEIYASNMEYENKLLTKRLNLALQFVNILHLMSLVICVFVPPIMCASCVMCTYNHTKMNNNNNNIITTVV